MVISEVQADDATEVTSGEALSSATEVAVGVSSLFDVEGKVYVITGSTSGIGLMMARGLVEVGATVVVTSRKADACAGVEAELSKLGVGACVAIASDISTEDGCLALRDAVADRFDNVHALVNNAGNTWGAPLAEHDTKAWNRVFDLNVAGSFHCAKFFRPLLDASSQPDDPSRIINFSSVTALAVTDDETYGYTASKAALLHLTKHLARKLAPKITVNCIVPGAFPSRMMKVAFETKADEMAAHSPMKRNGRQDDAVGALIYLTSRAASWVTGEHLVVDGGVVNCISSGGTD
jgi:NAD(P)-dependent dehydrogenase (short-subunit alcohol dehydrogenase family)